MNKSPFLPSQHVELFRIQIIAIIGSFLFLFFILYLIKKKKIKEEYSLLWLLFAVLFIVASFWRKGLDYLSLLIGVAYPPAALFLILLTALFIILIQFSIIISRLSENNKLLAQEFSILKMQLKELMKKNKKAEKKEAYFNEED